MKKYLSIIALIFVSSVALAQRNEKSTESSKTNRISMNVTVPKQTQGATFGEKVNAGLHAAGSALAQGSSIKKDSTSLHTSTSRASGNTSPLYDAQGLEVQNPLYKSEKTVRPVGPIKGVIVKGSKN